jgi:hypothetical protein
MLVSPNIHSPFGCAISGLKLIGFASLHVHYVRRPCVCVFSWLPIHRRLLPILHARTCDETARASGCLRRGFQRASMLPRISALSESHCGFVPDRMCSDRWYNVGYAFALLASIQHQHEAILFCHPTNPQGSLSLLTSLSKPRVALVRAK